ncbi:MAG: sulfatase-like hydrolase/transferase [Candidatus Omnitrophica bacterium]|nr:sulfatase-like hydrolase/transferase [Candidatus Omnitrophota bacterium]
MKKKWIIHPFLFAVIPVLHIFSNNAGKVDITVIIMPLAISLFFTIALWSFLTFALKDVKRAGIIVSIFLLLFFSYGHFYHGLGNLSLMGASLGRHRFLLPVWAFITVLSTFIFLKIRRPLNGFNSFLNVTASVVIISSLFNIGVYESAKARNKKDSGGIEFKSAEKENVLPDIYYIILDAYTNPEVLKDMLGYDEKSLINYLNDKGFYIAKDGRTNYTSTCLSLACSLNMRYIHKGENSVELVRSNTVMPLLKSHGYKIVNIPSGYSDTAPIHSVDFEINVSGYHEFTITLLETSLLYPFTQTKIFDYISLHRKRILETFDMIPKVRSRLKGPFFIFAHIVCPHPPYLFGKESALTERSRFETFEDSGNFMLVNNNWSPEFKADYLNQVSFVNKKVRLLVEQILKNSEIPPIIILQADHGSAFEMYKIKSGTVAARQTETSIKERSGILNAYYLPEEGRELLYDSITPVNTFRLVFNTIFNADFELLEDRVYWYDFAEVTEF